MADLAGVVQQLRKERDQAARSEWLVNFDPKLGRKLVAKVPKIASICPIRTLGSH
jgi:hypothetical protein